MGPPSANHWSPSLHLKRTESRASTTRSPTSAKPSSVTDVHGWNAPRPGVDEHAPSIEWAQCVCSTHSAHRLLAVGSGLIHVFDCTSNVGSPKYPLLHLQSPGPLSVPLPVHVDWKSWQQVVWSALEPEAAPRSQLGELHAVWSSWMPLLKPYPGPHAPTSAA